MMLMMITMTVKTHTGCLKDLFLYQIRFWHQLSQSFDAGKLMPFIISF